MVYRQSIDCIVCGITPVRSKKFKSLHWKEAKHMTVFFCIFAGILGAVFASFVNAAACRYVSGGSVVHGRSECPHCKTTLSAYELVPIFSYLFLHGRCRTCGTAISPRYLITEIFGALMLPTLYLALGITVDFAVLSALAFTLMYASVVDAMIQEIPDRTHAICIVLSAVWIATHPDALFMRLAGAFSVSLPLAWIVTFFSGTFGEGDVKLMFSVGMILGFYGSIAAFFLAVLFGGIVGAALMITKNYSRGDTMTFGTFLSLAIFIMPLFQKILPAFLT